MVRLRLLITLVAVAGVLVAPATVAWAQNPDQAPGLGIRLVEAPEERRNDPRAQAYIVDHVSPGARFERRIEVINNTDRAAEIQLYPAAAEISGGKFNVGDGRAENALTRWVQMSPPSVRLSPGESAGATVSIAVDAGAESGEYYAAALAEMPPAENSQISVTSRVGIRIYLSVGQGGEPGSDFRIESLSAERREDGTPLVRAQVVNTGGRALDLSGSLKLSEGPGDAKVGPVPADLISTIGPGGRAPVTVVLEPDLPAGPWRAVMTVEGSGLTRSAEAILTFPRAGGPADVVEVGGSGVPWWLLLLALLLLLLIALILFLIWRRRRRRDEDEEPDDAGPEARGARAPSGARR